MPFDKNQQSRLLRAAILQLFQAAQKLHINSYTSQSNQYSSLLSRINFPKQLFALGYNQMPRQVSKGWAKWLRLGDCLWQFRHERVQWVWKPGFVHSQSTCSCWCRFMPRLAVYMTVALELLQLWNDQSVWWGSAFSVHCTWPSDLPDLSSHISGSNEPLSPTMILTINLTLHDLLPTEFTQNGNTKVFIQTSRWSHQWFHLLSKSCPIKEKFYQIVICFSTRSPFYPFRIS